MLIVADDLGWGDVRAHGNDKIDTPTLDRLAGEGARFDRFYVNPLCAPTRAALLTGRYSLRTGTVGVTHGIETMRDEEITLAERLKPLGYATGIFGKWHNGAHYPYSPRGQGFDEFLGFSAGHWNNYFDTELEHNGKQIKTKGFITDALTDAAINFIEANRARPFFAYVPYNAPHAPFQVPDRYFDKYRARGVDDKTAAVYGMVENMDENIDRLLSRLDHLKVADNTIVIFISDNGPVAGRYNGVLKGRKASVDEGGVRVPAFVRYPSRIKGGTIIKPAAAHIDLVPTIMDFIGAPITSKPTLPIDGISLVPLLTNAEAGWRERMIFSHHSRDLPVEPTPGAVRTDRWLAIRSKQGWALYDMANDPGQQKDVAAAHPNAMRRFADEYGAWFKDVTQRGFEKMPIPVGYRRSPVVALPASEARLHGNVKWKGEKGYAHDWVTNWTSTDDAVEWDVDVAQGGRYEVSLLYTCSPQNKGAKMQIEIGEQRIENVVTLAYDPEPLPTNERAPREGVPGKNWATLKLGVVELEPGRKRLTIKAAQIKGKQAIDLQRVELKRQGRRAMPTSLIDTGRR